MAVATHQPSPTDPTTQARAGTDEDRFRVLRERRAAERCAILVHLMEARPELAGVHAAADVFAEAALWTV